MQLFVTHNLSAAHWQLGPLPPAVGRVAVVGWSAQTRAEESEDVLEAVAVPVAAALVACARVTFLCDVDDAQLTDEWTPRGPDVARLIPRTDWREWVEAVALRLHSPTQLALVSSRCADSVRAAFDSAAAPWWAQSQILLLSDSDAPPPSIERLDLRALCSDTWTTHVTVRARRPQSGIFGAVRPGVDGDIAAVFTLTEVREREVLGAFRDAAIAARCSWELCDDEADFAERLARPPGA